MKVRLPTRRGGERAAEAPDGPAAGAPGDPPGAAEDLDAHPASRWTGGSAVTTKAATAVLWSTLAAGPVALLLAGTAAVSSPVAPARLAAPAVDRAGEQAAVGEFAGRFVRLWLTGVRGQEAQLTPLVRGAQVLLPQVSWTAGPATTADLRRQPDGTYLVVVAVPVGPPRAATASAASSDPQAPAGTTTQAADPGAAPVRFFAVPVHPDATGLVALALPAPVAAPPQATGGPGLDYRYSASPTDPVGQSVRQFLDALLTGAGDVTRLVSPGSVINPVDPPPYTAVQLQDIATDTELVSRTAVPADGTRLRALVTAQVTAAPQQQASVQYPLTLTVRGGRWEITAIDPAPALQPVRPTPAPTGTTGSPAVPPAGTSPTTAGTAPGSTSATPSH